MTLEQVGVVFAIVLGVYGAVVSTIVAVAQVRRGRTSLRPQVSWGVAVNLPGFPGRVIQLEAVNDGNTPLHIMDAGFQLPDGRGRDERGRRISMAMASLGSPLVRAEQAFPSDVPPGRKARIIMDATWLRGALADHLGAKEVAIQPYVTDATGRCWKGEWFAIDLGPGG